MKAFSVILTGFFAGAFAAPTPNIAELTQNLPVVPEALETASGAAGSVVGSLDVKKGVVSDVTTAVDDVPVVNSIVKRAADATQVIVVLHGLLTTVQSHTEVINSTISKTTISKTTISGSDSVVGNLVVNELTSISIAISNVVSTLGPLAGTVTATAAEVTEIAGLVVEIVEEIAYTVFNVLQSLGLQSLLNGVLTSLTGIVASLLNIVEGLVGGVLNLVGELLNVPGIVEIIEGVFTGLLGGILSGDLTALHPVSL